MNWTCNLSHEAEKQLAHLPRYIQKRVGRAIDEMEDNPFRGDMLSLKGKEWKGWYRKRVGRYRIIFLPYLKEQIVEISVIVARDEKTYR